MQRIERVDFDLFLSDLDWDENHRSEPLHLGGCASVEPHAVSLKQLEAKRRRQMNRGGGRSVAETAIDVFPIEQQMLAKLKPCR